MNKKGKLVVIGSGIKSIGHFTLESQAHLQQADIVLYAAADPVTDMWIEKQNPNCFDLYQYYGNDKNRVITYTQMIERVMEEVRAGKYVCALFYGHPGVFVTPSHNAIALAQREGYEAEMLPGISAEDCLFADLGVDPSIPGLQTYEATDLLLRKRPINPEVNLIIFQVGCVGDVGFKFTGYGNEKFNVLLDYLEEFYAPEQEVVNYVASMFSIAKPKIDKCTLADLRKPEIAKEVTGISTFFIPAAKMAESDIEMSKKLGLKAGKSRGTPLICDSDQYSSYKKVATNNITHHRIPEGYKFSYSSATLYELVSDLALNFNELDKFKADPRLYLKTINGLSNHERMMLSVRHHGAIRMLFKRDSNFEAKRFVEDVIRTPHLVDEYINIQEEQYSFFNNKKISFTDYEARLVKWFLDQGYATTPMAVTKAISGLTIKDDVDFSGNYRCKTATGDTDHIIEIEKSSNLVKVDNAIIKEPHFSSDRIIWMFETGNNSSGILTFSDDNGIISLKGKYVTSDNILPENFNIIGIHN